jgi:hypothetical protein
VNISNLDFGDLQQLTHLNLERNALGRRRDSLVVRLYNQRRRYSVEALNKVKFNI